MLAARFKSVVIHVNTKRIQASEFQRDKEDPLKRTLQIDYGKAYQCMYQDEVQGALWSRQSVNLFTYALTHKCSTDTMLSCSDYTAKDKYSNRTFVEYLYEHVIQKDESVSDEIIWSDSPSSEFKNKYMVHLLQRLSSRFKKKFIWKFIATSHGKGVIDGIGSDVKSLVRSTSMS